MQNIEQKLGSVFSKQNEIDSRLKTGSSSVLSQKLEFTAASKQQSSINNMLKDKYVNLAPSPAPVKKSLSATSVGEDGEGLPHPRTILFSADKLNYNWRFQEGGAGFQNYGNTCYLNAVLQCLVHTPPLTNYLMSGHHFSECEVYSREKCIMCNLQMLMKRSLTGTADSFSPKWFINNLQLIGRHFRNGRQEDAHEFLRLSLDKMQKCALAGNKDLDKYSKETTVINQIFGGFLRSQVVCLRCKHRSNTYDPALDISLDIKNADSIERAFERFVAPDKLDMDNAYKCEKCKQKVPALKRFSIHKPPNVLTIQFKRFQFAQTSFFGGGGKISRPVRYPARLNIRNYMSNKNGPPQIYSLYATIQHEGYSCQSGHYVSNVRCGQRWYHFNDSMKRRTSVQQSLNETSAYVLFYVKDDNMQSIPQSVTPKQQNDVKSKHQNVHTSTPSAQSHKFIGPVKSQVVTTTNKSPFKPVNQVNGIPTNDLGTPIKSPLTPLSANREKIRINLGVKPINKTPPNKPVATVTSPAAVNGRNDPPTPRLVMKIKDGKSITIETSPDGERRIVSDDDEVIAKMNEKQNKKFSKKSRLVPYGDGSSSDSDWGTKTASSKTNGHVGAKVNNPAGVVFDQKLNTTTSVPGNNHLYETVTLKDKLNHTNSHNHNSSEKLKEYKISPKQGHSPPLKRQLSDMTGTAVHSTPLKRQLSETVLSCVTTPVSAKHVGRGEWLTSSEGILSPSVDSSHSSTHSNNSTGEWSVSKKAKLSVSCPDRLIDGWTVTPSKNEGSLRKSVSETSVKSDNRNPSEKAELKDHAGYTKPTTNMKRQVMQEQLKHEERSQVKHEFASPYEVKSDKSHLLADDTEKHLEELRHHKKSKKHKKHKKQRHDDKEPKYTELSEESSDHTHKKKKKKKKHKHKTRDVEEESRVPVKEKVESHKRGHEQEYEHDNVSSKRSRQASESSTDYEWVEKKVEAPLRTSKSTPGTPRQSWDHHIKDGYRKPSSGGNTPIKSSWDGLKASKVVQELQNLSSYGYGAPVSSWEGSQSHMDTDKSRDRSDRRRTSDDEYEQELDQGKTKKVKVKHEGNYRHNGNVFQEEQDSRNRGKLNWSSMKIGDNNPYNKSNGSSTSFNKHQRF